MAARTAYINYKKLSVAYDLLENSFDIMMDGRGTVVRKARVTSMENLRGETYVLRDFGMPTVSKAGCAVSGGDADAASMQICYSGKSITRQDFTLEFLLNNAGVTIRVGGGAVALDHQRVEGVDACLNEQVGNGKNGVLQSGGHAQRKDALGLRRVQL